MKSRVLAALVDGLAMGLGFTGALTVIGLIRELLGAGTLFAQASNLLGPSFSFLELQIPDYRGALLMILPPDDQPVSSSASIFFEDHASVKMRGPFRLIPRWTRLTLDFIFELVYSLSPVFGRMYTRRVGIACP